MFGSLNIGIWNLFVIWYLSLGFGNASLTPYNRHPIVCPKEVAGVTSPWLITDELLHTSCSPIADFHFFTFNNDRHFPYPVGHFEHFLELFFVVSDIYVSGLVSVSRPGFVRVGSTGFAVNNYFVCHASSSFVLIS
jgi:hypothetical protein